MSGTVTTQPTKAFLATRGQHWTLLSGSFINCTCTHKWKMKLRHQQLYL